MPTVGRKRRHGALSGLFGSRDRPTSPGHCTHLRHLNFHAHRDGRTQPAWSSRVTVVVVQRAAQALTALVGTRRPQVAFIRADDSDRAALMIPLGVIVLHEVLNQHNCVWPAGRS